MLQDAPYFIKYQLIKRSSRVGFATFRNTLILNNIHLST